MSFRRNQLPKKAYYRRCSFEKLKGFNLTIEASISYTWLRYPKRTRGFTKPYHSQIIVGSSVCQCLLHQLNESGLLEMAVGSKGS